MESKTSGPSIDILWPTLLSLAVAVSGYLRFAPQLTSLRPQTDGERHSVESETKATPTSKKAGYPSRLWEDPLGDAYQAIVKRESDDRSFATSQQRLSKNIIGSGSEPRVVVVTVPPGTKPDDVELRTRTRYAVHAALGVCGYRPSDEDQIRLITIVVPSDPDSARRGLSNKTTESPQSILVPFEWFRDDSARRVYGAEGKYETRFKDILVFWLPVVDSDGRSLRMVGAIRKELGTDLGLIQAQKANASRSDASARSDPKQQPSQMPVQVIGPYNSDLFVAMTRELDKIEQDRAWPKEYGTLELYPWRATLEFTTLKNVPVIDDPRAVSGASSQDDGNADWKVPTAIGRWRSLTALPQQGEKPLKNGLARQPLPLKLISSIGSDWHLAQLVRDELRLRNAWPDDGLAGNSAKGFIAIVTEQDTLYGNSIPLLYESMLPKINVTRQGDRGRGLLVYRYLQGIDGSSTLQEVRAPKNGEPVDQRLFEHIQGRDPTGNYQIDYLRRLGDEIEQQDRQARDLNGGGILAIGVMGSDVYDKLIILRALRARFPNTWFFTHDLDDNFSRPSELDYTQNLLVASHFGLALHPALQREVPPFRDSYQTSAYFSMLMAVWDARTLDLFKWKSDKRGHSLTELWPLPEAIRPQNEDGRFSDAKRILSASPQYDAEQHLAPLMYEIGRHGPYQLTTVGNTPPPPVFFPDDRPPDYSFFASVQPAGGREVNQWAVWKFALVALAVILFIVFLGINMSAFRDFMLLPHLWPKATDVRSTLGVVLLILLRWLSFAIILAIIAGSIVRNHSSSDGQPLSLLDGISAWPGIVLRGVAVLCTCVFTQRTAVFLQANLHDTVRILFGDAPQATETTAASAAAPVPSSPRGCNALRAFWDLWSLPTSSDVSHKALVSAYQRLMNNRARLIRSFIMGIVYFALSYCILTLTDSIPNNPARGALARNATELLKYVGSFSLCFITFLVVDVERLGQQFVRKLGRRAATGLPQTPANSDVDAARRAIRAIAVHTHGINRLVWYPFIVMGLLVVARQRILGGDNYPLVLAIVQTAMLLVLYFYTWRIRVETDEARTGIVRQLHDRIRGLAALPGETQAPTAATKEQLEAAVKHIEDEEEGAFGHWTQDYFLKALALPFLGESGFLLLQKWSSG